MRRPRLLFLNRSYWPDAEATGQLLTELAEDLAAEAGPLGGACDVAVVCGRPNSNPSGEVCKRSGTEVRRGVTVHRVRHTTGNKGRLRNRAVNFTTFLLAALARGLFARRADVVVVETDPFLLALAGVLLKVRHRAKLVIYAQDIHPDLGVALGVVPDWRSVRLLNAAIKAAYRRADRVVVLSRDMRNTVVGYGVDPAKVRVVPNWTDGAAVRRPEGVNPFRERHGLGDAFVVMHSGNMGQTQRLETLLDAAARLRDRDDVRFLLIGNGSLKQTLRDRAAAAGLANVSFLPYEPKETLHESLSAADLHVVSIDPRVVPYMMPSKLYGVLASGSACVAIAPPECELAATVREEAVGWVAAPGDAGGLADRIAAAADDRAAVAAAGRRARTLSERFDRPVCVRRFAAVLDDVRGVPPRPGPAGAAAEPPRPAADEPGRLRPLPVTPGPAAPDSDDSMPTADPAPCRTPDATATV